jgi:hypothetical protein
VTEGLFFLPAVPLSQSDVHLVSMFNILKFQLSQFCDTGWVVLRTYQHGFISYPKFNIVKYCGNPSKHSQIPSFPVTFLTTERHWFLITWLINNPGSDNKMFLRDSVPVDFRELSQCMGELLCHPHIKMEILQGTCRKLQILLTVLCSTISVQNIVCRLSTYCL